MFTTGREGCSRSNSRAALSMLSLIRLLASSIAPPPVASPTGIPIAAPPVASATASSLLLPQPAISASRSFIHAACCARSLSSYSSTFLVSSATSPSLFLYLSKLIVAMCQPKRPPVALLTISPKRFSASIAAFTPASTLSTIARHAFASNRCMASHCIPQVSLSMVSAPFMSTYISRAPSTASAKVFSTKPIERATVLARFWIGSWFLLTQSANCLMYGMTTSPIVMATAES